MSLVNICAMALLAVALPLSAQPGGQTPSQNPAMSGPAGGMNGQGRPPQGAEPGMMAPRPFAGVDFNKEQQKQIQAMMAKERNSHQQRVESMRKVQEQLQKLYMADKWDTQAITKLYETMHAEQRKTIAAMAEARNKVYEMMSKEQREQMKQFQQQQMKGYNAPPPKKQ